MFLRIHRIGRLVYTEALEAYRDPVSRKPKHRCLAHWPVDQPFAVALGEARFRVERDRCQVVGWQKILDGTVPRSRRRRDAPELMRRWQAWLAASIARLAGLEAVHARLPAAASEVQAAPDAARQRWDRATPPVTPKPAKAYPAPVRARTAG